MDPHTLSLSPADRLPDIRLYKYGAIGRAHSQGAAALHEELSAWRAGEYWAVRAVPVCAVRGHWVVPTGWGISGSGSGNILERSCSGGGISTADVLQHLQSRGTRFVLILLTKIIIVML